MKKVFTISLLLFVTLCMIKVPSCHKQGSIPVKTTTKVKLLPPATNTKKVDTLVPIPALRPMVAKVLAIRTQKHNLVVKRLTAGRIFKLGPTYYKWYWAPGEYTSGFLDSLGGAWTLTDDNSLAAVGATAPSGSGGPAIGLPHKAVTTPANKIMSLAFTNLHSGGFVSLDSGRVFTYGQASSCQLGNGLTSGPSTTFEILVDVNGHQFQNITAVSGGWGPGSNAPFNAAIKGTPGDTVWAWGNLSTLGGGTCQAPTPFLLPSWVTPAKIYAYNSSIHVISTADSVYVIGGTDDYSANTGTNSTPTTFTHIAGLANVNYIAKGNGFVFYVCNGGTTLYANGEYGWLIKNTDTSLYDPEGTPINVTADFPSSMFPLDTMVAAHVGWAAIDSHHFLWTGGSNEVGLCGTGPSIRWPNYTTGGSTPYNGTPAPWNWNVSMGNIENVATKIAGDSSFINLFGGALYSFYFIAVRADGSIAFAGRDKAANAPDGIIFADTLSTLIASAYHMGLNHVFWTNMPYPFSLTKTSVTTMPGCATGAQTGSPCSLGGDAPVRPNTNQHSNLVLTAGLTGGVGWVHWDATTSTTDASHQLNWSFSYITQVSGAATGLGARAGSAGTFTGMAPGTTLGINYTLVDQSWDTVVSSTQTITIPSSGGQTGYYWDTAGSGTACTFSAPCAPSYFNTAYASETAGDTNYFKRGETFKIQIVANSSGSAGNPIVSKPYGTGNLPVLGGRTTLTGWTNVSGNIWQVAHTGVRENILQHNDSIYTQTTFPDLAGGWNTATSISATQITDAAHVGQVIVGSKICIRSSAYTIDTAIVTNISGSVITFSPAAAYSGGVGWKVMNITPYEYGQYQDTLGQIRIFSIGAPTGTWTIATVDTVLLSEGTYQEWDSLKFQGGNNANIILAFQGTGFNTFKADSITDGFDGFEMRTEGNLLVKNTIMRHFNNNAVWKTNTNNYNNSFLNDTIYDCGMQPGMGKSGNVQGYSGIIAGDSGSVVKFCSIYQIGYCGVANYGSGFKVDSNYIKKVCWILEDGGFIYTWIASLGTFAQQREMIGNVCDSSGGPTASLGTTLTSLAGYGIYLDQWTSNVLVSWNSIGHTTGGSFFDHGPSNTFLYNTSYGSLYCDFEPYESGPVITGLIVKHNIWGSASSTTPAVRAITINNDIPTFGTIDSNQLAGNTGTVSPYWTFATGGGDGGTFRTLSAWTSLTSYDLHTTFQTGSFLFYYSAGVSNTVYLNQQYQNLRDGIIHFRTYTVPTYSSSLLAYYGYGYLKHFGKIVLRTAH